MTEYIERGKIYYLIERMRGWCGNQIKVDDFVREVKKIPAADARVERYGQWEVAGDGDIQCSKCGASYKAQEIIPRCFCPCCGAKTDEENGEKE